MKLNPFTASATDPTTLDAAELSAVNGGRFMPPPGGGGAPPNLHLGLASNLGKVNPPTARCKGWKTWNSPQAIGVLEGGGLTRVPMVSCPGIQQAKAPKVTVTGH